MTLRDAIRTALFGGDSAALRDVPADDVAQAVTSYADTASLAEADALAPLVTRASHVPFDSELDGDLGAPIDDVHAEIASLDLPVIVDDAEAAEELDPSDGFDDATRPAVGNDIDERDPDSMDRHDDADEADVDPGSAADSDDFGSGNTTEVESAELGADTVELDEFGDEPVTVFGDPGADAINIGAPLEPVVDSEFAEEFDADDAVVDDGFGDVDFDV